jgi:hypothetical protein
MTVATEYDFSPLEIRRRLGRDRWSPPRLGPGPAGVHFQRSDRRRSVIVSSADWDGVVWLHASIAANDDAMPTYEELVDLRAAVWGEDGWAFQVFAPPASHVNIHSAALHLWGRLDGQRIHPDFGFLGTI